MGRVVVAELWGRVEIVGAVDEANPPTPDDLERIRLSYIAQQCGAPATVRIICRATVPRFGVEPDGWC